MTFSLPLFSGVFSALPTPFSHQEIDKKAFKTYLAHINTTNISGVVVAGTTGESLTLSSNEKRCLLNQSLAELPNKKIIMGITSCHIQAALKEVQQAEEHGAKALLILPPYYVKADEEALFAFFATLHQHTSLPIILYNNPGRLGFELSIPLIKRLAKLERIQGLKEASSNLNRLPEIFNLKKGWSLLGGDDTTFPAFLAMGGHGLISVASNVAPSLYTQLWKAWHSHHMEAFHTIQTKLAKLNVVLCQNTNPASLKHALMLQGWMRSELRVPLSPLSPAQETELSKVLAELELFNSQTRQLTENHIAF